MNMLDKSISFHNWINMVRRGHAVVKVSAVSVVWAQPDFCEG